MNQEEKQLFQKFEKEVWLFLDGDLPEMRINFWEQKIEEYPSMKKYIEEYKSISETYSENVNTDILDHRFNEIIDGVISQNKYYENIKRYFKNLFSNEQEFVFGKIAFASALIIAAILISVIFNNSNPISKMTETINPKVLDWDAELVDEKINKIGEFLKLTSDEDYRKYYKYGVTPNNVDKNISLINGNIETLKKKINNKKL